jgi:UDP-GlcNAc:undecaprenyl-phosphate GlcNAc-1-phosphate transferase
MTWPILLLIPVGLAVALPATALVLRMGHRLGAMDSAGAAGHEKTLRAIPNIGGVAIYAAVVLPMAAALLACLLVPDLVSRLVPALTDDNLARLRESAPTAGALLLCLTALHVMGLIDDRRGLGPWLKLAIQFGAASVMVIFFDVRLLTVLGPVPSCALSILWIVVITNAINFLDNMDGLAGGVSAIAAGLFMIAALVVDQWFIAASLALLIGALVGFLMFNFPPARIFMGDGGSLVVGFLLAVLTARTTYLAEGSAWYGVLMPVVVLAIPVYDFLTVTFIRLRQGRSPFVGDQQHLSHRLVQRGLSRRGAVIVIWSATFVTGVGGIALGTLEAWQALLVGMQTLAILVMLGLLEFASRHAVQGEQPT